MREPRLDRPRVLSESTDVHSVKPVGTSLPLDRDRSSSVDRLDDDTSYEPSPLRDSSKSFSRSETDLGRSVRDNMPSAKLLKQHYEDVVRRNAAMFGGQVPRRRTRPTENHIQTGPDLNRDEGSKPDKKLLSSNSQSDVETIPTSSSRLHLNYSDRIAPPPKVVPTSAKVTSRYGRLEEMLSVRTESEKPAQPADVAISKPVVMNQDHSLRPVRRLAAMYVEDESVVQSVEAWKTRRRSNRSDEPEKEHPQLQTFDEKPLEVTNYSLNSVETSRDLPMDGAHENESTKPTLSEQPASIFGVALRSRSANSKGGEVKTHTELETKVPDLDKSSSLEPASASHAEADLPGEPAQPRRRTSSDLRPDDVDNSDKGLEPPDTADSAGRRRRTSVELAEVPHFPKDSVLLTGGHLSTSPRSSFDGSHYLPPLSPDVKADDHVEDSVFAKDFSHTEHLDGQRLSSHSSMPSDSTLPDSSRDDMLPSVDHLASSDTSG